LLSAGNNRRYRDFNDGYDNYTTAKERLDQRHQGHASYYVSNPADITMVGLSGTPLNADWPTGIV